MDTRQNAALFPKAFKKKVRAVLSKDENRRFLVGTIRDYEMTQNLGTFLVSLGRLLTKPKRLALLADIRQFVPSHDLPAYDEEVAVWLETKQPPGVLPLLPAKQRPQHASSVLRDQNDSAAQALPPDLPHSRRSCFSFFSGSTPRVVPPSTTAGIDLSRAKKPTWTVTLKRKRKESFGFSVAINNEQLVMVTAVLQQSPAHKQGLRIGDVILTLGDFRFQELPVQDAIDLVSDHMTTHRQMRLMVRPGAKSQPAYTGGGTLVISSGLSIKTKATPELPQRRPEESSSDPTPPKENAHALVALVKQEPAARPHVRPRASTRSRPQTIHGAPAVAPVVVPSRRRKISLHVPSKHSRLGLHIRGNRGFGIVVTDIDSGSLAESVGLQPGDRILEVNGQSFVKLQHSQAIEVLNSNRHLVLTVINDGTSGSSPLEAATTKLVRRLPPPPVSPPSLPHSITSPKRTIHAMLQENQEHSRAKRRCIRGSMPSSRPLSCAALPSDGMLNSFKSVPPNTHSMTRGGLPAPISPSADESLLETSTTMFQEAPTPGTQLGHYLESMSLGSRPTRHLPTIQEMQPVQQKPPIFQPRYDNRKRIAQLVDSPMSSRKALRTVNKQSPNLQMPAAAKVAAAACSPPRAPLNLRSTRKASGIPSPPPPPPMPRDSATLLPMVPPQPAPGELDNHKPVVLSDIRNFNKAALRPAGKLAPWKASLRANSASDAISPNEALMQALQRRFKKCNEEPCLDTSWRSES